MDYCPNRHVDLLPIVHRQGEIVNSRRLLAFDVHLRDHLVRQLDGLPRAPSHPLCHANVSTDGVLTARLLVVDQLFDGCLFPIVLNFQSRDE